MISILPLRHKIPHTYQRLLSLLPSTYIIQFFFEVSTDDRPDTCATIKQNSTNPIATLPTGHIGFIQLQTKNLNIIKQMTLTI